MLPPGFHVSVCLDRLPLGLPHPLSPLRLAGRVMPPPSINLRVEPIWTFAKIRELANLVGPAVCVFVYRDVRTH